MAKIPSFPLNVGVERIFTYLMLKNSKLSLFLPGRYLFTDDVDIHLIAHSRRELRYGSKILAKSTTFKNVIFLLDVSFGQTASHHNSENKIDQDMKLETHDGLCPSSSKNGAVHDKNTAISF